MQRLHLAFSSSGFFILIRWLAAKVAVTGEFNSSDSSSQATLPGITQFSSSSGRRLAKVQFTDSLITGETLRFTGSCQAASIHVFRSHHQNNFRPPSGMYFPCLKRLSRFPEPIASRATEPPNCPDPFQFKRLIS
jgi:hypothetical protein